MRKYFRNVIAIAVILTLVFVITGCQQTAETQSSEPAVESSAAVVSSQAPAAESAAVSASEEVPAGGYKIAYTSNYLGNSWRTEYEQTVRTRLDAYKEKGVVSDYTYVACNNDVTEQLNQLNALLQEDYDVIMIEPVSVSSLTSVIEEAQNKGIKLVMGGSLAAYEGIPCFMTDKDILSKAEAYYLCDKLGGEGNVVNIYGFAGSIYNTLLAESSKEIYAKYPGINLLAEGTGGYNDADAQTAMATLLATYGDQIDGVWCEDGMAYGIVNAFQNAGKATVPMGGDYFNSFIQYWYNNQDTLDTMMTPESPYIMGRAIADCCVYIAAGYEVKELKPNPADPSIENWCELPTPYMVFEKDEMNPAWLSEFPATKAMSIDDAYKLMEGKEETASLEVYCDDDYIASLFGLDRSLWW